MITPKLLKVLQNIQDFTKTELQKNLDCFSVTEQTPDSHKKMLSEVLICLGSFNSKLQQHIDSIKIFKPDQYVCHCETTGDVFPDCIFDDASVLCDKINDDDGTPILSKETCKHWKKYSDTIKA